MPDGTFRFDDASIKNKHVAADAAIARTKLGQNPEDAFVIPLTAWRVHDALGTPLATPASDDLGLASGTFSSAAPYVSGGDLKAAGSTTRRARVVLPLPPNFDPGATVMLRAIAGMTTNPADVSCTIDFEAYLIDPDTHTYSGSDLVTTAATTINSTTMDDIDFALSSAALEPGQLLDIRMTVICNDAATVSAVIPSVFSVELRVDTRG